MKRNRLICFINVVLFTLIGGYVSPLRLSQAENVSLNEKVLSFENLNRIEKFEDLVNYGLVPPGKSNYKSGKNLIILALKSTAYFNGEWLSSHGLLGVNMLGTDIGVHEWVAYRSLFFSTFVHQGFKMYANNVGDNDILHIPEIVNSNSIITRREAVITAAGYKWLRLHIWMKTVIGLTSVKTGGANSEWV